MTADLSTTYLGLTLDHPLVASAGPLSSRPDGIAQLIDAGAAAIVLPSLFEEDIRADQLALEHLARSRMVDVSGEARGFLPDLPDMSGPAERYIELIEFARREGIPIIASLNGVTPGGWTEYARAIEEAGAAALELNLYLVAADPADTAVTVEQALQDTVSLVCAAVSIPVAVKLSPFFTSLAHVVRGVLHAGASGVVLFNRFYQPDIDLDALAVVPSLNLSTSMDLRLPLRWTAIVRNQTEASIALSGGVHTPEDVIKAVLAGADVVMTTSSLLRNGASHLTALRLGLARWLDEHDYASVDVARGSMSQGSVPDPDAYERANYHEVLRRATATYLP